MEKFKVLSIEDTTMEITDQHVAVVELSKIKFLGFILPDGTEPFSFLPEGTRFVYDYNSKIAQHIIQAANNDEVVTIDLTEFQKRNEMKNGKFEEIFYHRNVKLIDFKDKKAKNEAISWYDKLLGWRKRSNT